MLELILITLSLHTPSNDYNNQNWGAGIEYTQELTYGVYLYHNSYEETTAMISASKQWDRFGLGVAMANGYQREKYNYNGFVIAPEFTIKLHDNIRVKTSYPIVNMLGGDDVFNLQFNFPLDFN